ncbi:MAG: hypothetical protein KDJ17_07230 [Hyphomicrobiaceae bacterium]|nr:hypothetical protein [Hyphomicrobiaceae bacterium]
MAVCLSQSRSEDGTIAGLRLRWSFAKGLWFVVCLLCAMPCEVFARPPSKCRLGNQSDYVAIASPSVSEDMRKDLRLRVLIDALDDVDVVFRGQLSRRWYLSDVLETDSPKILEVYHNVTVLKGSLPQTAKDRKVYLIRERICDGGCWLNALPEVFDGRDEPEVTVLAMTNTSGLSSEVRDRRSNRVIYTGRIDALAGPCDPRMINGDAVARLIASPGEVDRLRRSYPPRSAEEKQRDEDLIIRRVIGAH